MEEELEYQQAVLDADTKTCVAAASCTVTSGETTVLDCSPIPTQTNIRSTTSALTARNHWDHVKARFAIKRSGHRVEPGLYALGSPTPDSPVFVSANYTLSFDALRSALAGIDSYILVLDTEGINVWCAAGKGTFGTDELVHRIEATALQDVVSHRVLILPQLGAPGVAAHEVKKRSGFKVEYGPVRASDLPEYLETRKATPEMRQVRFGLADRLVLIPVEMVAVLLPVVAIAAIGAVLRRALPSLQLDYLFILGFISAVFAGVVLFPILLPWLPTRDFSSKGFILGGLVALPFAGTTFLSNAGAAWWRQVGAALPHLLALPAVTAYLGLNFTGSTTFTSRTGVRREIFTYTPIMAWMFGIGIVLGIILFLLRVLGGL
jgi:hypothetical protein